MELVLLGILILVAISPLFAADAVKEQAEALPCRGCGSPTWSSSGLCFKCRRRPEEELEVIEDVDPVTPPRAVAAVDDDGRLAEDLPCRGCGYNLRGLIIAATCPECSVAVERSIHGDFLAYCDPSWTAQLGRGLAFIRAGMIAVLAMAVGSYGLAFVPAVWPGAVVFAQRPYWLLISAASFLINLCVVYGVWMLTKPDPGTASGAERILSVRRLARWFVTVRIVMAPLELYGGIPIIMADSAVYVIGNVLALIVLRQLLLRVPQPRLARHARAVMVGYVICQVVVLGGNLILAAFVRKIMAGGTVGSGVGLPMGLLSCAATIAMPIFTVWAIVLLGSARKVFDASAKDARRNWQGAAADEDAT